MAIRRLLRILPIKFLRFIESESRQAINEMMGVGQSIPVEFIHRPPNQKTRDLRAESKFIEQGYAAEYVEGMWRMLQADEPDDYVLATGTGITVRDFLAASFAQVDLEWQKYVKFDERYLRPTEVDALIGDSSKAQEQLGWKPTIDGLQLAKLMVDADVQALQHEGTHWIDKVDLPTWKK